MEAYQAAQTINFIFVIIISEKWAWENLNVTIFAMDNVSETSSLGWRRGEEEVVEKRMNTCCIIFHADELKMKNLRDENCEQTFHGCEWGVVHKLCNVVSCFYDFELLLEI